MVDNFKTINSAFLLFLPFFKKIYNIEKYKKVVPVKHQHDLTFNFFIQILMSFVNHSSFFFSSSSESPSKFSESKSKSSGKSSFEISSSESTGESSASSSEAIG